ncbi:MAG: PEP-CTERM sorting domain-containing protein [bacterium]
MTTGTGPRKKSAASLMRTLVVVLSAAAVAVFFLTFTLHRIDPLHSGNPQESGIPFFVLPTLADEPPEASLIGAGEALPNEPALPGAQDQAAEGSGARPWYGLCPEGRVKSVRDFQDEVLADPMLRTYYDGFDWNAAQLIRLEAPVEAYLSYKKNGRIVRTKRKMSLPAGDAIITDGRTWVRAYCCNEAVVENPEAPAAADLSAVSVQPAADQPADAEALLGGSGEPVGPETVLLDSAGAEPAPVTYLEPSVASFYNQVAPHSSPTGPMIVPSRSREPDPDPPEPPVPPLPPGPPPTAPIPEPATLQLLMAGLGAWGAYRWRRRGGKP